MVKRIEPWQVAAGLLILSGAFLRLYRLPETVMFQGDQGRDASIVKRLIIDHHPPLLGPTTSVGNMYLGPLYYYFMSPFLWLTYPNPVGPAYGVALLSILTLPLMFAVATDMFGRRTGLISLVLLTFMEPVVYFGRFSWNPNPAPFVGTLLLWTLFRLVKTNDSRYLILATIAFGIISQLHYLALILGTAIGLTVLYLFITRRELRLPLLKSSGISLVIFAIFWMPLVVFDFRHQGLIHRSFQTFFTNTEHHVRTVADLPLILKDMEGRFLHLTTQLFGSPNYTVDRLIALSCLAGFGWLWGRKKIPGRDGPGLLVVATALAVTTLFTAVYQGTVFDHYLLFAIPVVVLWWGYLLNRFFDLRVVGPLTVLGVLAVFVGVNAGNASTFNTGGPTIAYLKQVTDTLKPHVRNGRYNLALISDNKDFKGMNYRYFLETSEHPPQPVDRYENLDYLVVIDEVHVDNPLSLPNFEIRSASLTSLTNTYSYPGGPTIYIYTR